MKSKIITTALLLLLITSIAPGQSSMISFYFTGIAGGNYSPLDRIDVRNLDRHCDTTLLWPDTVLTINNVGMDDMKSSPGGFHLFQNAPNPVEENTTIRMYIPESGPVRVQVSDLSGRTVISLNKELTRGYHAFLFTPAGRQMYFFTAVHPSGTKTVKIASVSSKQFSTGCLLSYQGTCGDPGVVKSEGLSGRFLFALGDNLQMKGYHNSLSATITDVPVAETIYTFILTEFICGSAITINHLAGPVAPVTKTVTYGTVANIPGEPLKCWITSNLGADRQATSVDDATEPPAGWYWQFNRLQGYKYEGNIRTPNTTWIFPIVENLYWKTSNDPCAYELGNGWRIPTFTEWFNVDAAGGWSDWNDPWNSGLKLHAAGTLGNNSGSLISRGSYGFYWAGTPDNDQYGRFLYFYSGRCFTDINYKSYGFPLRCLRE